MNDYIAKLEQQNAELQEKLAAYEDSFSLYVSVREKEIVMFASVRTFGADKNREIMNINIATAKLKQHRFWEIICGEDPIPKSITRRKNKELTTEEVITKMLELSGYSKMKYEVI
jgi:hypothetical protein